MGSSSGTEEREERGDELPEGGDDIVATFLCTTGTCLKRIGCGDVGGSCEGPRPYFSLGVSKQMIEMDKYVLWLHDLCAKGWCLSCCWLWWMRGCWFSVLA